MDRPHRGTIFCEDAQVLAHARHPGEQYVLRLHAPDCARTATPGTFVHIRCDPQIPMRRPLSIMGASPDEGWIEVLYKVVGQGLAALAETRVGARVSLLGPIGRGFRPDPERPRAVLIGGGVGIPPLVFLADRLGSREQTCSAAFLGSELPFPFPVVTRGYRWQESPQPPPAPWPASKISRCHRASPASQDWPAASRVS